MKASGPSVLVAPEAVSVGLILRGDSTSPLSSIWHCAESAGILQVF